MKGFKVEIGDREFTAALPSGTCGVIITYAHDKATIDINGVTQDLWSYRWLKSELSPGETISVLFTEVEQASEPVEVSDIFRRSKEEQARIVTENELKAYYELRKELIEEGVIGQNE